jgi:hypothetical protein
MSRMLPGYYLLASALLLLSGLFLFPSSGRDDVHIGFWTAWMLLEHGEILNYSGERLEQSSSLLHTLLLTLFAAVTRVEIATLGTPLSLLFGVLAVIEAGRLASRLGADVRWALLFAATSTPLVYWAFGAMETTLVAWLLTAFARATGDFLARSDAGALAAAPPALWAALYLMARPEAVFVLTALLAFAFVVLIRNRGTPTRLALVWVLILAGFAALALWRQATYGAWFPQPVSAKVDHHIGTKLAASAWYLMRCLRDAPLLFALLALSGVAALRLLLARDFAHRYAWLALGLVLAQLAFVIASGGDWMEGARFLVPVVPAASALAAWALGGLSPASLRIGVCIVLVAAQALWLPRFAVKRSTGVPLTDYPAYRQWAAGEGVETARYSFFEIANRVHLRDALFLRHLEQAVDALLARQDRVNVMSVQGGMVPYHLFRERFGRLRFIDMGGLVSRDFSDCELLRENPLARGAGGLGLTDAFYLSHMDAFRDRCGIPIPDVYYNIDGPDGWLAQLLEDSGRFRVVHRQRSRICVEGLRCPPSVQGDMTLAVRADLLPPDATPAPTP